MEPVRVGVIGSGTMGARHVEAWSALEADVTLYSPTASRRAALAAATGVPAVGSLDRLLATVEIIDLCTPTDTHRDLAVHAARAGRHVICEKPLARTLDAARDMVTACATAGVGLYVAEVLRYFPGYADAQRVAAELGVLRSLRLIRAVEPPAEGTWVADPARSGGVLVDLMIHDYDYARWVAGEVVAVQASGGAASGQARLTHASGAVSEVSGEWGDTFRSVLEIEGSAGSVRWDAADGTEQEDPGAPYRRQLAEFRDAIHLGTTPRVTAADGVAALRIALAAEESSRTGRVLHLAVS